MESQAMLRQLKMPRRVLALIIAAVVVGERPTLAQVVPNVGPADAIDVEGSWAPTQSEDVSNDTVPVDYVGLPLNDAGRTRALSYNESQLGMIERQCEGWSPAYLLTGPFGMKITASFDPIKGDVLSYTIAPWEDKMTLVIWMDGRPHPSQYHEHTRSGFTTGRWENGQLITVTTHMQQNFIRKNGPPLSDRAKMTLRFKRHQNMLLVIGIIEDPLYLAEPLVWTRNFVLSVRPIQAAPPPCIFAFEGTALDNEVPHWLWGKNPYRDELTTKYGIPQEAVLGYPETLYPEYRLKLPTTKATPRRSLHTTFR